MDVLNKSDNVGNGAGKFEFQVGANANQLISIQLQDFRTDAAGPVNADLKNSAPGKAATVATPAVVAQPQISTLTLSGAYKAADTIKLDIGTGSITYKVQATDIGATPADTLELIRNSIVSTVGIDDTLGVVLTSEGTDKINFTGPTGVSFTPIVTTTIADEGKVTVPVNDTVTGTSTVREANTLTLSGTYQEGDVITLKNGTATLDYTVKNTDTSSLTTLASSIVVAASGNLEGTTAQSTGAVVTFTALTVGAGELDLSASVKNANLFATTQVAKAMPMAVSQVPRALKNKAPKPTSTAAKAGQRMAWANSAHRASRQCATPPGTIRNTTGTIKGTNTALK
jgi:hypothetical protein